MVVNQPPVDCGSMVVSQPSVDSGYGGRVNVSVDSSWLSLGLGAIHTFRELFNHNAHVCVLMSDC